MKGKVYLVGAGPGDPELLTLKALRALKNADVVLHDSLVAPEILAFVSSSAQVRDVGKRCGSKSITQERINWLLVQYASRGLTVVRLKGGDPLVFGRAGEEIEALRKAEIEVEIVPGVTAALGAAAAAQIPLTDRKVSSAVLFLTGHHAAEKDSSNWPERIPPDVTLVIYMPGYNYAVTADRLLAAGLRAATPCAVISQATSREQQVYRTTIGELRAAPRLPAPTLLMVGEVARLTAEVSRFGLATTGLQHDQLFSQPGPEVLLQFSDYTRNQERPE